jgi:hypothetical protein
MPEYGNHLCIEAARNTGNQKKFRSHISVVFANQHSKYPLAAGYRNQTMPFLREDMPKKGYRNRSKQEVHFLFQSPFQHI